MGSGLKVGSLYTMTPLLNLKTSWKITSTYVTGFTKTNLIVIQEIPIGNDQDADA